MNREKALIRQQDISDENLIKEGVLLVNEIYNSFESQVCRDCERVDNCHWLRKISSGKLNSVESNIDSWSCSYWKLKD